jgi:P pilus assembly chaperone PapD
MPKSGFLKKQDNITAARYLIIFLTVLTMLILSAVEAAAQGLLVIPRRVVFEGTKRTQELNLANAGNDTTKYTISIVEIRMKEDGSFEEVDASEAGQNSASANLRIFPRIVTLGPNEAQTVKVQLTNTSKLTPGEYRSHIYFRALPKQRQKGKEPLKKMVTNLSLKLTPVFGVTIPVIVRVGDYSAKVSFSNLAFEMKNDTPRLNMVINRAGSMSIYGNISVSHISPEGNHTNVGIIKGFGVYSPNATRKLRMVLNNKVGVNYSKGTLEIVYTSQVEDRPVKMAESMLEL